MTWEADPSAWWTGAPSVLKHVVDVSARIAVPIQVIEMTFTISTSSDDTPDGCRRLEPEWH